MTPISTEQFVSRMVAVAHLLGTGLDARVGTLQAALDSLEAMAGADRERARLHSAMAAAYLVDDRLDEAITHFQAALQIKPDYAPAQQHLDRVRRGS